LTAVAAAAAVAAGFGAGTGARAATVGAGAGLADRGADGRATADVAGVRAAVRAGLASRFSLVSSAGRPDGDWAAEPAGGDATGGGTADGGSMTGRGLTSVSGAAGALAVMLPGALRQPRQEHPAKVNSASHNTQQRIIGRMTALLPEHRPS